MLTSFFNHILLEKISLSYERYINELIPHLNEGDSNNMKLYSLSTFKKISRTTCTNKMHLPFSRFNHKDRKIRHVSFYTTMDDFMLKNVRATQHPHER